jgi:carboxyl-terminal processing protease
MKSRGRLFVLIVSLPIIAFAVIGGFMGKAMAQEEAYRYLRIFEDVVTLIMNNYVEEIDPAKVMDGAMHGLADNLDPDSAYLDVGQVKSYEQSEPLGTGRTGLEITRQYYLRVVAARDASPAAKAGLMPGDYIRAIDGQSTRDTSVYEGARLLAGKPGTKVTLTVLRGSAAEPHTVELVREEIPSAPLTSRMLQPGIGYVRIPEFTKSTTEQLRSEVRALSKAGATSVVFDLRGTAFGDVETGLASARLFVPSGTLAFRQERGKAKEAIPAAKGEGDISLPLALLTDSGTSGPAELFAAALGGNKRATLVGERTLGRAARQRFVKLPDGSGLLLTHLLYLTPDEAVINQKGLTPDVAVEQPDVEFGEKPPATDTTLDKAIEQLKKRTA